MKDPWGRVESQAWPSDKPVWTRSVYCISALVVCAGLWFQYQTCTALQRYWLPTYLSARISPIFRAPVSTYRLMLVLHPDGTTYLPQEDEVESGSTKTSDGLSIQFALSDEARRQKKKLVLTPASPWKNALLSDTLRAVVYRGQTGMDWAEWPLLFGGAALSLGLAVAAMIHLLYFPRSAPPPATSRRCKGSLTKPRSWPGSPTPSCFIVLAIALEPTRWRARAT
jgi:hypothetical protein